MSTPFPPTNSESAGGSAPRDSIRHFISEIIDADNASGKWGVWGEADAPAKEMVGKARVHTRFPPEPNGYLHLGHAKSICLNFGLAVEYGGKFNLRFDDTNPAKEEQEYVDSIKRDVKWITSAWSMEGWDEGSFDVGLHAGGLYYASDYFLRMYEYAADLIRKGLAYVCELSGDEVSARRGKPGVPATSPWRDRPIEESLRLFEEMREGKHPNGKYTLRAKIDLASPNFNLRDPVMYRILHEHHHNTGDKWPIYPMYDWAHGIEDGLEQITHSICTLEFEDHRPLYDWFMRAINVGRSGQGRSGGKNGGESGGGDGEYATNERGGEKMPIWHSQQIEFAKLIPTYTILSKRNLLKLVQEGRVGGWDDPRMPTIAGVRRRGYPAAALRAFCEEIGVTKTDSMIDIGRLENAVRERLNRVTPRAMGVLRPLKVVVENWEEGKVDELDYVMNPEDPEQKKRKTNFSKVIYIERDDFLENPPKKFFRLYPGGEVRLRWAYFLKCENVIKNEAGEVVELRCTIDPATRGGDAPVGPDGQPTRKVKGTIHWVSAQHAVKAEIRLFDRLFSAQEPGKRTGNFVDDLNAASLEVVEGMVEPWVEEALGSGLAARESGEIVEGRGGGFQFERLGYFCMDRDSRPGRLVLNRTVTLKDGWAKEAGKA